MEPMVSHVLLSAGVTTAFHPFSYTKTLVQLGYEPLPPVQVTTIFGKRALAYPNVFQYLQHIRKVDGFIGMYRGLVPRMAGGIIGSCVTNICQKHSLKLPYMNLKERTQPTDVTDFTECDDEEDTIQFVLKETSVEMISRCTGVIVSHPFHVIMVRSMAQFIGRETGYTSLYSSVKEIYNNDGILGFFAGLVPRLVGEMLTVWFANLLAHTLNKYVLPDVRNMQKAQKYTNAVCSLVVTQLTYPFSVISNVMAVSNCGLKSGSEPFMPNYTNWVDCWSQLARDMQVKRGSSLFWRYYRGPTIIRPDGSMTPI